MWMFYISKIYNKNRIDTDRSKQIDYYDLVSSLGSAPNSFLKAEAKLLRF